MLIEIVSFSKHPRWKKSKTMCTNIMANVIDLNHRGVVVIRRKKRLISKFNPLTYNGPFKGPLLSRWGALF